MIGPSDEALPLIVRSAGPRDAEGVCAVIEHSASAGGVLRRALTDVEMAIDSFAVAEVGQRIIGCAALHVVDTDTAEVRSVAVHEDAAGLGVGSWVVDHLLDIAEQIGLCRVFLVTKIPGFFSRMGFSTLGDVAATSTLILDHVRLQRRTLEDKSVMLIDLPGGRTRRGHQPYVPTGAVASVVSAPMIRRLRGSAAAAEYSAAS